MELTIRLLLVVLLGIAGCLPGPELLRERYNAELLVLGVEPGVTLEVAVGGRLLRPTTPRRDGELTMLLSLPPGEHEGVVRVRAPRAEERCAPFTLHLVDEEDQDTTSVDVRGASVCEDDPPLPGADGGPDDADPAPPVFASITEQTTTPAGCGPQECFDVLIVTAEGDVLVREAGVERSGEAPLADLTALAILVMSAETDALFADGCESVGEGPEVILTRERLVPVQPLSEILVDEVEVTGCDDPAVAAIRGAMAALRSAVFGS